MYDDLWIPLTIVAAVFGFFFLVVVGAALWEKRPVQPFDVPAPGEEYAPSPDAVLANHEAGVLGYEHGGFCHDGKGRLYRVRYDFWIAPDGATVAAVGSGTVARIPWNGVSLWSRLADGRILCTTNEIGDQDISGAVDQQTWPGSGFRALAEKHESRLTDPVEPFPAASPIAGVFDILRRQADALVEKGFAYYLDEERRAWRYTLKGALVLYFVSVWLRPIRRGLRLIRVVRD